MIHDALKSAACIKRVGPVLTREQVPFESTLVFNAGVCKFRGRYVMLFRNAVGEWNNPKFRATNLGVAFSDDGVRWNVQPEPVWGSRDAELMRATDGDLIRVYDPRLIPIDEKCYVCFACDTHHGLRGWCRRNARPERRQPCLRKTDWGRHRHQPSQ